MFQPFRDCFGKMSLVGRRNGKKKLDNNIVLTSPDINQGRQSGSPGERLTRAQAKQVAAQENPNPLGTELKCVPDQPSSYDRQQGSAANRITQQPQAQRNVAHPHEAPNNLPARILAEQVQLPSTDPALVAAASVTPSSTGLNASRIQGLQPGNVVYCDPMRILEGVTLTLRELGRGSYGIVVPGNYRGVSCAVKIMLTMGGLDRAALHELLLGPGLVHPNVVSTYLTRCAVLTNAFFDFLEGERRDPSIPSGQRVLDAPGIVSGDGFGDPCGSEAPTVDPMHVLHQALHALEACTGQTVVIVIQEFCNKGTLKEAIDEGCFRPSANWSERLAIRSLLRTAAEMARGLLHLHDSGVVHGDFKPANVLLHTSKDDRRGYAAKIADFGLCHVLPQAANSIVTASWGSIAYMAPEAFDGKVSRATDVWALGVVMWEMVVGKRPYDGVQERDLATLLRRLRDGSVALTWPTEVTAGKWAPIAELAQRCMSHTPGDRPPMEVVVDRLVAIERDVRAATLAARQESSGEQH